jgi:hypothetical protein
VGGAANTGGGAGGAMGAEGGGNGTSGGSGVLIVRYRGSAKFLGGTVTPLTIGNIKYTLHTFNTSGSLTPI